MIEIVSVGDDELDAVMALIREATSDLDAKGIAQWDEIYPDRETFARDAAAGDLWGLRADGSLAAVVVLNFDAASEYDSVPWHVADPRPLIVHRLCVDPAFQGKGFARRLMEFAERFAAKSGARSIRLDAFVPNVVSRGLYRSLGYAERGRVRFRKGEFVCLEKAISESTDRTA
jgi:GNAT superfamily N-acetyltransferase